MREKIRNDPKQIVENNHEEKHRHKLRKDRGAEHFNQLNEERWIHNKRIMILLVSLIRLCLRENTKAQLDTTDELFIEKARNEADDCEENNVSDNAIISKDAYHGINHGEGNLYQSTESAFKESRYSGNVPRINNATSENCRHRKKCRK